MFEFEQQLIHLQELKPEIDELHESLNILKLKNQFKELNDKSQEPDFWNDINVSNKILQNIKQLTNKINTYESLAKSYTDTIALIQLADEIEDADMLNETALEIEKLKERISSIRLTTLLTGEFDKNNAIITFHSGAGGTEAQDWVMMLFRMYGRWADRKQFKTVTLNIQDGDEAGIKSANILVRGENAYGYLKSETGVHRLVRISPFDSSGRRHTSFASIEVIPEINDDIDVNLKEEDLRIDTYRASGAGGQHVNTTDSAVRITHVPTGVVTACQNERSQRQNKEMALRMLKSKLYEIKKREHLDKIEDIKGEKKNIEWGSQIRSYVFMPYTLVKDHRTNFEVGNVAAVMDGDLDNLINAYLKALSKEDINT